MERPADEGAFRLPFTLGHENAGWVHELGPGVTGFTLGDPVIVYRQLGQGRVAACHRISARSNSAIRNR